MSWIPVYIRLNRSNTGNETVPAMRWLALHCLWWFIRTSSWLFTSHLEHINFSFILSHCNKTIGVTTWTCLIWSFSKTSFFQLFRCCASTNIAVPAKLFEIWLKHHFDFNLILKHIFKGSFGRLAGGPRFNLVMVSFGWLDSFSG